MEDGTFEVKGTGGDTHLGGEDFDNRLVEYCLREFERINKLNKLNYTPRQIKRLKTECEKAKRILSSAMQTTLEVDSFYKNENEEDFALTVVLTRAKFEELCSEMFKQCIRTVDEVI